MKTYLAYFDLLGFKDFIEHNGFSDQGKGIRTIIRDIKNALSDGTLQKAQDRSVPDFTKTSIQVLNFSDTIIFWTKDDSEQSLNEILQVAYKYNQSSTIYSFPARGALTFGEIRFLKESIKNNIGGAFYLDSIVGKGLVDSYLLAESTEWSGAIIDSSVVNKISNFGKIPHEFLKSYAKTHQIPFKNEMYQNRFAFKLCVEPINNRTFLNYSKRIEENFSNYNKRVESVEVQRKLTNTIDFLRTAIKQ